jgi:hypothetical protein
MKYFVDILKQFTRTQRLVVLILLLSFTTGTYLTSQYWKTSDCESLIEENLKMQEDFIKISKILREERLANLGISDSTAAGSTEENLPKSSPESSSNHMDEILKIAESHQK